MLNKIWFGLLLIGLLYGLVKSLVQDPAGMIPPAPPPSAHIGQNPPERGKGPTAAHPAEQGTPTAPAAPGRGDALAEMGRKLTTAGIDAAKASVEICLGLIGIMALWLGFMRVAEEAGLIALLARGLRPVLRFLFPEIPRDHPAGGAIIMNFAANILGLDNAATPLGLKAMKELQTLNPLPDTATNSMAMFLAINTSSITLVPFTIIGYRAACGSGDPAGPVVAMTLATTFSTIGAVVACRLLQPMYPLETSPPPLSGARPPSGPPPPVESPPGPGAGLRTGGPGTGNKR